jgi:hypothetical protein
VIKVGGLTTVVVATATAACGLLMLSGAGPTPAAADDEAVPAAPIVIVSSTEPATTDPATTEPAMAAAAAIVDSSPSSTATTTTPAAPIPLSVAPQSITVGAGGTARISGECPVVDGVPLGPVEIWEIGSTVTPISTGVTAAAWAYDWTAPADVEPLVLQVWCGDPSQYAGGYPESLQIEVVFVAQEAPTTTTTTTTTPGPSAPHDVIPETG